MLKFESPDKAREIIEKTQAEINSLIQDDLQKANCAEICLDKWMDLFCKEEEMQAKYHKLCGLEIALINAQLYLEHHRD